MPTIELNRNLWGSNYEWPQGGDEWSQDWGGRPRTMVWINSAANSLFWENEFTDHP